MSEAGKERIKPKQGWRRRPRALYLHSEDAKDDEERAADEHDVPDGLQRCNQSLHYQLQAWSSTDNPERDNAEVKKSKLINKQREVSSPGNHTTPTPLRC